jgi:hypothetical protein
MSARLHPQQQTQSASIRPYQAAVALSNMGVTLLERRSYADAVITIRDALFLIRAFADPERFTNEALPTDEDIQYVIHRATNCLLYHSIPDNNSTTTTNLKLKIVSDHQSSVLDIFSAVNEADMYLVRIDDTINPIEDYASAFTIHSKASAILLNYGTACQCLHLAQRDAINGNMNVTEGGDVEILEEAMLFLKISYRILLRQMEPIMRFLDSKNLIVAEMEVTRTLNLTALVLQTLINVCYKLGQGDELLSFRYEFDSVCTTITKIRGAHLWRYNETAPSA